MTDERTRRRAADLLPEEQETGSADRRAQAAAILADSDRRETDPGTIREHRTSDESV